jgi:phosphatidylserine/phosphatidylglycerophosphate/cardiolipin synthase-like enzyme
VKGDQAQQPHQNKGNRRHHKQMRQLDADKLLAIDAPMVQQTPQESLLGKDPRPHRQQKHKKNHSKLLLID